PSLLGAIGHSRNKRTIETARLQGVRVRRKGLRPNRVLPNRRRWLLPLLRRSDNEIEYAHACRRVALTIRKCNYSLGRWLPIRPNIRLNTFGQLVLPVYRRMGPHVPG